MFRNLLEEHDLCSVNMFYPVGPTYWSHLSTSTTRIDFICMPRAYLDAGRILSCHVDVRAGDRLQLIRSTTRADHRPLIVRADITL
eukprot:3733726-Heterocapsa_arctica.AAC.1